MDNFSNDEEIKSSRTDPSENGGDLQKSKALF